MSSFGGKIPNFRSQKFKQLFKNSHHLLMLHQISQSLRASRAQGSNTTTNNNTNTITIPGDPSNNF